MRGLGAAQALSACALLASVWTGEAAPALAQGRGIVLDDITALRDFAAPYSAPALSSDGSRIAIVTRTADLENNAYVHEVHVIETSPPFRDRVIAQAGDTVLRAAQGRRSGVAVDRIALWSPDDAWIAYLVGNESYAELWRVRSSGGRARRVSIAGEHVVSFSWATDGALRYQSAISRAQRSARIAEAARYGFRADDRFEPVFDVAPRIDDSSAVSAWRVNIGTGQRSEIDLAAPAPAPSAARIVPADARFADAESPELALETDWRGEPHRCAHDLCRGELLEAWTVDDDTIAFQRQAGHHGVLSELAVWSIGSDSVMSVVSTEARLSGCVYAHERFFCLADSSTQPQRLVAIDAHSGRLQVLWDPNPSWTERAMPRIERLDTTNPGGEQSFAHLVYPLDYVAGRRYPVVIVQYRSRGFLRGGTGGEHPILPLSTEGYFVLSVDRPENFTRARIMTSNALLVATELDGSEANMKTIAIEHFLSELERRGLIDPDRIGITGMSDGTETLFHLLLSSERRFAAAVTSSPPPDPSVWPLMSNEVRLRRAQNGALAPWNETSDPWMRYWRRLSPIYHLDRMRTPILFNLSETETLPAMPLIARLQEIGAPYDLFVYPGAYHNKWRPAQIRAAQTRAMAWLNLWLRDVDTPDPQDQMRTAHWRAMRDASVALH